MPAEAHPKFADSNIIFVGNNLFVSTLLELMRRMSPRTMRNFYIAHSLEQAHVLLHGIHERQAKQVLTFFGVSLPR